MGPMHPGWAAHSCPSPLASIGTCTHMHILIETHIKITKNKVDLIKISKDKYIID